MTVCLFIYVCVCMHYELSKIDIFFDGCLFTLCYRYLGTNGTFASLAVYFARGETTVGGIVTGTAKVIWQVLKEIYMQVPNREQWKATAERFESLWNLSNCIGAIDGKHVRIEKFPNSDSSNFNYKSFYSTVLLACCDADGLFAITETGYAEDTAMGAYSVPQQ